MLARLLSQKLLHAAVVEDDKIGASIAAGGTRVTYAIDGRQAQAGRLRHDDGPAPGENRVHVATLLGATLIGMKAGARAPFLQADGSFRSVSLLAVTR
jgi:transcription elongation GreA/GreB family factor